VKGEMRQAWFELRCQGFVRLCPTLQGWGGVVEWWGEEDKDERGIRVVDGDCDILVLHSAECRMVMSH